MVVGARIGLIRRKLGRRVLYISVDSQTHAYISVPSASRTILT